MNSSSRRRRQYAGLALVILVYLGGILGWSWAVLSVDGEPTPPDSTRSPTQSTVVGPGGDSAERIVRSD